MDHQHVGPELVYDPDPSVWLVGPTEQRPLEQWVPGAVDVLASDFEISDPELRRYVNRVLERFASDESSPLTDRLMRWRSLGDTPFVLFLGMIDRAEWSDAQIEGFLTAEGEALVEPAIVTDVESTIGTIIRRSIAYITYPEGLVAGVRYVIQGRATEAAVVMHSSTRIPGNLIEALGDVDVLAGTVDVRRAAIA